MTNIAICGANGKMGKNVYNCIADRDAREVPLADGAIDGTLASGPAFAGLHPKDAKSSLCPVTHHSCKSLMALISRAQDV